MKNYICFFDSEKEYMLRLSEQLNIKNNTGRSIICFTDRTSFEKGTDRLSGGILIVAEKDWDSAIASSAIAESSFCMILDEGLGSRECVGIPHICKYNSAGEILKDILDAFSAREGAGADGFSSSKKTYVYGVVLSGLDGQDCLFALSLAGILGKKGPSLFIDLGSFSPFAGIAGGTARGLSDILYYMHSGGSDIADTINASSVSIGNLSYIPTVSHPEDLRDLSDEDIRALLSCVCEKCIYEYVIISFPMFISDLSELFDIPKTVFIPETASPCSKGSIAAFTGYLDSRYGEDVTGKIKRILLPECFRLPPGASVPEEASFGAAGTFTAGIIRKELSDM